MEIRMRVLVVMASLLSSAVLRAADLRLVDAVRNQDQAAVRSLLREGVDVNAAQPDGATALAWAAHRDDLETADLLIRAKADVNAANEYGATPLSLACSNGNAAMVEKLLNAGANPNAALLSGETPLMTAVHTGSLDVVNLLLAHQADVNAKEPQRGQTALMWAVAEKRPEITRALVAHGADLRARSKSGFTPLLYAADRNDLDSARILVEAGADVNEATADRVTPLLLASARAAEGLALFLLEKGADPNASDSKEGYTPLHHAASHRNMASVVKALLSQGASPNARLVKAPPRPREFGTQGGINMLGSTPLLLAAANGNGDAIHVLVEGRADARIPTAENTPPLLVAAGVHRNPDVVLTPEEREHNVEAARLLLELGADVNATGEYGWTALHGAAYNGFDEMIQFLVSKGAKMDILDQFGQTPLSIALAVTTAGIGVDYFHVPRFAHPTTVDLLLKLGATPLEKSGVQQIDAPPQPPQPQGTRAPSY
jgi:ankyrin repeat protein